MTQTHSLSGKNLALAGRFTLIGKKTVAADAKRCGFSVQASVNGKTEILVVPSAGAEEAAATKATGLGAEVLTEREYLIRVGLTPSLSEPAEATPILDRIRTMVSELHADPRVCITRFRMPPPSPPPAWLDLEEPTLERLFRGIGGLELRWVARANPRFDSERHESVTFDPRGPAPAFDGIVNIPSASDIERSQGWGRPFVVEPDAIFRYHDLGLTEQEFFDDLRPFDLFASFWPVGLLRQPDGDVRVFVGDDEGASWRQASMTVAEYLERVLRTYGWTEGRAFERAVSREELLTTLLPASWPK